jgi:endo-1,4-beta-xylanase
LYVTEPELERLIAFLDLIAGLGLDVELTELDVAKNVLWDDMLAGQELFDAQADAYDVLASACLSVSACTGLTTWGIDDSDTWLDTLFPFELLSPNLPLLLDTNLEPKPAYLTIRGRIVEFLGPPPR